METTLHDHILHLENRIQAMSDQLTDPNRTHFERERLESEIQFAELALTHYRAAFDLEQRFHLPGEL